MRIGVCKNKFDPITKFEYENLKTYLSVFDKIYLINNKSNKNILNLVIDDKRIIVETEILENNFEIFEVDSDIDLVMNGNFNLLERQVVDYIYKNRLYYSRIAKRFLSDYRYKHSVSVSNLCVKLAKKHGIDENKAYIAGILHDIYKEIDKEKSYEIMNSYFQNLICKPYPVHHSYTATIFLKECLLIDDEDILDAVFNHTICNDDKPLSKILYIADKLDPLRGYDVKETIKLCMNNLDEGFNFVKNEQTEFLRKKEINE